MSNEDANNNNASGGANATPDGANSSSSSGGKQKVTADSYGNVDVSEADRECWMLRVPPKLAEAWEKLPEGAVLGELVFCKGGKSKSTAPGKPTSIKPSLTIHVAPHVAEPDHDTHDNNDTHPEQAPSAAAAAQPPHQSIPLEYTLQAMTKKLPTLHPFQRLANGSIKVAGTVTRTANLQVHQDSNYRALCKTRILQTTVHNSRYVKPVESNQVVAQSKRKGRSSSSVLSNASSAATAAGGTGGFGEAIHQYGKRLLDAANAPLTPNKKAKFTQDQPTRSVIFQLFSQQYYWTVKDLKQASGGRPETEIRDVLREIGDYHRSGDTKNTWELRKEFQNTSTGATGGLDGGTISANPNTTSSSNANNHGNGNGSHKNGGGDAGAK
jgi:hypothetical protein